jgi:hypothetical protein
MTKKSSRASVKDAALYAICLLLFFMSTFVFIFYEHAHFDSDQAISGIMARHLAHGIDFPVFTYGAKYVLGFETWLAAPFMAWFGTSVAALKFPLFLLFAVTILVLLRLLRKEAGLSRIETFFSAIFLLIPVPIAASRLINAAVGVPTSYLACLMVWVLWSRPILLGLLLGFVVPIRPFVLYAVFAMIVIEFLKGNAFSKANLKKASIVAPIMVAMVVLIEIWGRHGPNYQGPSAPGFRFKDPIAFFHSFQWLLTENLPALFGLKPEALQDYNISSSLVTGQPWMIAFVAVMFVIFLLRAYRNYKMQNQSWRVYLLSARFSVFIFLIGAISAWVYTGFVRGAENIMLVRYTILSLFSAIGLAAFFFQTEPKRNWKLALIACIAVWFASSAYDHARLIDEYVNQTPPNPYRGLVNFLEQKNVVYAKAPFWTAAHVTFFSDEKIRVTEDDFARINDYVVLIQKHANEVAKISVGQCVVENSHSVQFDRWCVENLK